ncbi:MAG: hypothetical protein ACKV1O_13895 [Saprospiraceae bacterium]
MFKPLGATSRFRWDDLRIGKDRAILMICIGIALFFWLLVKLSQNYRMTKAVYISIHTPVNKALSTPPPGNVAVQLQGTGWQLLGEHFSGKQIRISYDAEATDQVVISSGQLRQDIQKKLSATLRIIDINLDHVVIELEDEVYKKIPVALLSDIDFAPEYQLKEAIHVQPDSILISGPTTLIGSIQAWPTDSLILSDLKHSTRLELALQQPPKGILIEIPVVKAFIEVEAYTAKSLFIPLSIINAPDSVRVFPDKIKLECTVGLSLYNEVDAADFVLEVDIGGVRLKEGKTTVPIVLKRSPDFVRNIHFTPQAAEFFIFKD